MAKPTSGFAATEGVAGLGSPCVLSPTVDPAEMPSLSPPRRLGRPRARWIRSNHAIGSAIPASSAQFSVGTCVSVGGYRPGHTAIRPRSPESGVTPAARASSATRGRCCWSSCTGPTPRSPPPWRGPATTPRWSATPGASPTPWWNAYVIAVPAELGDLAREIDAFCVASAMGDDAVSGGHGSGRGPAPGGTRRRVEEGDCRHRREQGVHGWRGRR